MPEPLVANDVTEGRLVRLGIEDDPEAGAGAITVYAAHQRERPLCRAGSWLLRDLRARLA